MNNLILAAGLNHIAIKIFQNSNDQDLPKDAQDANWFSAPSGNTYI